jgi:hypothetical protein
VDAACQRVFYRQNSPLSLSPGYYLKDGIKIRTGHRLYRFAKKSDSGSLAVRASLSLKGDTQSCINHL